MRRGNIVGCLLLSTACSREALSTQDQKMDRRDHFCRYIDEQIIMFYYFLWLLNDLAVRLASLVFHNVLIAVEHYLVSWSPPSRACPLQTQEEACALGWIFSQLSDSLTALIHAATGRHKNAAMMIIETPLWHWQSLRKWLLNQNGLWYLLNWINFRSFLHLFLFSRHEERLNNWT